MGYKMNGFSGFGNSPAKQKEESFSEKIEKGKVTLDGKTKKEISTERNKEYEGMDESELFFRGKTKDKDGNVKDIQWAPQPNWTIEGTKENDEYKRKK
jgi:hypothetical protein